MSRPRRLPKEVLPILFGKAPQSLSFPFVDKEWYASWKLYSKKPDIPQEELGPRYDGLGDYTLDCQHDAFVDGIAPEYLDFLLDLAEKQEKVKEALKIFVARMVIAAAKANDARRLYRVITVFPPGQYLVLWYFEEIFEEAELENGDLVIEWLFREGMKKYPVDGMPVQL